MRFLHLAPFIAAVMATSNSAADTAVETQKQPERFQAKIINHSKGTELEEWLFRLLQGTRGDLHSIVRQSGADKERKFLDSFVISLDPPATAPLSINELKTRWETEKLLEIIDGLSHKVNESEIEWDSSVYIGDLGEVIGTDNLRISGENITGNNLQNSITVAESIIMFTIVEDVIQRHPLDISFICDLLSQDGTYLISLRLDNQLSGALRSDLSDDEKQIVDRLTAAWKQRKGEHKCPDIGVIDAKK
jgi:hypothetical protein